MHETNDEKIKRYIEELGEEYKEMLLEQLLTNSNTFEELNVRELIRLDEDIKRYLKRKNNARRNNRYYILGGMYFFFGIYIYLLFGIFQNFNSTKFLSIHELIKLISIILSIAGICICALPFIMDNKRTQFYGYTNTENRRKILELQVISLWSELEGLCYNLSQDNSKTINAMSVIDNLAKDGFISREEISILKSLLKKRNSIAHDYNNPFPINDLTIDIQKARIIINKIKKITS